MSKRRKMNKNYKEFIHEFTLVICPICKEHYLLREGYNRKRSIFRKEHDKLSTGETIKLGKLFPRKRDMLRCQSCGDICKYDNHTTLPCTPENYEANFRAEFNLRTKKYKQEHRENHLERLHALKAIPWVLKNSPSGAKLWNEGRDWQIKQLMEGINHMADVFCTILLRVGAKKGEPNLKVLNFTMARLKRSLKEGGDYEIVRR